MLRVNLWPSGTPRTNSFIYTLYHNILCISSYICVTKHKILNLPIYKGASLLGKKRRLYPIQSPNTIPVGCDLRHYPDVIYLYYRFSCWMCLNTYQQKNWYIKQYLLFSSKMSLQADTTWVAIASTLKSVVLKCLFIYTPHHRSALGMYSCGVRRMCG